MKNILTVIKKELKVVFGNKRLLFSIILMPGLLIFAMYTVMGKAIQSRVNDDSETYRLAIVDNTPKDFIDTIPDVFEIETIKSADLESKNQEIYDGEYEVVLQFEEGFETKLNNKTVFDVNVYYNPSEPSSETAYQIMSSLLEVYQSEKMIEIYKSDKVFKSNTFTVYNADKANAMAIAMILPFLLITFLFSASVSVTPESIAGEKERGTLATLLVTQVKRSEIAIGKIISLSILSALSGVSSFIGTMSSMPALMGQSDLSYNVGDYAAILVIIIVTVILITGLLSLVSAYAKTVKEATMLASPLMIFSMVIGISSMLTDGAPTNPALYFIPIYNSVQVIVGVLNIEINYVCLIITVISNIIYTGICVFVLSKMFNSEKIMFSR